MPNYHCSNELQTCDWPRNVLCNRASRKRQHVDVAKSRIDVQISSSEEPTGQSTILQTPESSSSVKTKNNQKSINRQEEDLRHPRVIEEETANSFDSFGKKHVIYSPDKILNDESLSDIASVRDKNVKRKVNHLLQEQSNETPTNQGRENKNQLDDTDANVFQDKTERSFVTIDVRLDPGHGKNNLISVDSKTTNNNDHLQSTSDHEIIDNEEEEQDLSAIPSKLLYKNDENVPDYNLHEAEDVGITDDAPFDIYDYDFEDYIAKLEADEALYYTFWNDPIYDEFVDEKTGKKVKGRQESGENVTLDYSKYPERPGKLYPNVNNVEYGTRATECNERRCRLPDCMCGKSRLEDFTNGGKDKKKKLPQLVVLTFDDSVNDLNRILYEELFDRKNRVNPNGCPILATFYISHEWTDYAQVQNLYADGHEIASHSISHRYDNFTILTFILRACVRILPFY